MVENRVGTGPSGESATRMSNIRCQGAAEIGRNRVRNCCGPTLCRARKLSRSIIKRPGANEMHLQRGNESARTFRAHVINAM